MMDINDYRDEIHENAVKHGFHAGDEAPLLLQVMKFLMLASSEIGEASEALRHNRWAKNGSIDFLMNGPTDDFPEPEWIRMFENTIKDTVEDEIGDAIIRLLDLCGKLRINIGAHMACKMRYNRTRPPKHGKMF